MTADQTASGLLESYLARIAEGTDLVLGVGGRGALTLQVYSTFAIRWLIPHLPGLQKQHPDLRAAF